MPLAVIDKEATKENIVQLLKLFKCQHCGKCCDGTFGDKTILSDKTFMKLPCAFLKENRCTIYPTRPQVCRQFPFNQSVHEGGKDWITISEDCPAGRELIKNYANVG